MATGFNFGHATPFTDYVHRIVQETPKAYEKQRQLDEYLRPRDDIRDQIFNAPMTYLQQQAGTIRNDSLPAQGSGTRPKAAEWLPHANFGTDRQRLMTAQQQSLHHSSKRKSTSKGRQGTKADAEIAMYQQGISLDYSRAPRQAKLEANKTIVFPTQEKGAKCNVPT